MPKNTLKFDLAKENKYFLHAILRLCHKEPSQANPVHDKIHRASLSQFSVFELLI